MGFTLYVFDCRKYRRTEEIKKIFLQTKKNILSLDPPTSERRSMLLPLLLLTSSWVPLASCFECTFSEEKGDGASDRWDLIGRHRSRDQMRTSHWPPPGRAPSPRTCGTGRTTASTSGSTGRSSRRTGRSSARWWPTSRTTPASPSWRRSGGAISTSPSPPTSRTTASTATTWASSARSKMAGPSDPLLFAPKVTIIYLYFTVSAQISYPKMEINCPMPT